jgi:hypothetical protein
MKPSFVAAFLAALTLCLAAGVSVAYAGGSTTSGASHCNPGDPTCPANPLLMGPVQSFVTVQGTCPAFMFTDQWVLNFVAGNAVFHETANKNGDWGGFTGEGLAVLTSSDGTVQYTGHATEWGGGGNNSGGQSEGGFTLTYNGSGPAGPIHIHANQHSTTNNAGTPTNGFLNATLTCG